MYKIFVRFNYEDIIKGYYKPNYSPGVTDPAQDAKAAYEQWKWKYARMGYDGKVGDVVYEEPVETKTNEEWVYTVTRIPFCGSTGDPGTGEVTPTPTGMTDTIEIHLELSSKAAINPMGIKMPDNWTKARAMSVMTPPKNEDSFPGDFITVFIGSGRFNYKYVKTTNGEMEYEAITVNEGPQFLYRTIGQGTTDRFTVKDKIFNINYQAIIYRPLVPDGQSSSFTPTPTPSVYTVSAYTTHGYVTGEGRYPNGYNCTLEWHGDSSPYSFVRWSNGVTANPYTFVVTKDTNLTAEVEYAPARYTLTFNATGGSCSPSTFTGTTGQSVEVTVTPDTGYAFMRWEDGSTVNPRTFVVGTQSAAYSALCETAVPCTFIISSTEHCSVTVNGQAYTDPVQVNRGTQCTIACIPDTGYGFKGWTGEISSLLNPYTFTVPNLETITSHPVIEVNKYELSFADSPYLTFRGAGIYDYGTQVEIEAVPRAHAQFDHWWDGETSSKRTVVVDRKLVLSATGSAILYHLTVNATPLGGLISGNVFGEGDYAWNSTPTITFTPLDGKTEFVSWSDGGTISHQVRVTEPATVTATARGVVQGHSEFASHGSILIHPSTSWVYGDEAKLEFVPDDHYHFVEWSDHNTDNPRYFRVNDFMRTTCEGVIDSFTLEGTCPHFKINAYVNGVKVGQLPQTFDYGTVVTLKAEECDDVFFRFQGWSDGSGITPVHSPITVTQSGTYNAASYELAPNCLRLKSTSTNTICIVYETTGPFERLVNCFYSMDGESWTRMPEGSDNAVTFSDIKIRGNNLLGGWYSKTDGAYGKKAYLNVQGDGLCDLSGNISSLLNEAGGEATVPDYSNFKGLFRGAKIASVTSEFFNVMADSCYSGVFEGSKIESIPVLPSKLESSCFGGLFKNCTSITSIPGDALPATTLASSCYAVMFQGCTGLTSLPEGLLPATTLANSCYGEMFEFCTGLTSIPGTLLPAGALANNCYNHMFSGCRGLTSIPNNLLPATTLAEYCYYHMFSDCRITSVPQGLLHVRTLVKGCYDRMFYSCYPLCEVHCAATDVSASDCTFAWLYDVAATGDFYCPSSTQWSSGTSGIPSGWTRHDEE